MELCEKYSVFATTGRSTLTDAPKDVRRLEALKPSSVPSMRERYESAIGKEKRLEAATRPAMKQKQDKSQKTDKDAGRKSSRKRRGDDSDESDAEEEADEEQHARQAKQKKTKKKRVAVVNEADLRNVESLKEEDEVQEGIEWSDSE